MTGSGLLRIVVDLVLVVAVLVFPVAALAGTERFDFTPQKLPVLLSNQLGASPNDDCASPVVISTSPFTDMVSTVGASTEPGEPQPCGLIGSTIWYQWTSGPKSALIDIDTFTSDYDTTLALYTGTCGSLTNVACNDDAGGLQSYIHFIADPNTTYLIQAGGFDGSTGNLVLHFSAVELNCPPIVIEGVLGSNSTGYPGVSGTQNARLVRDSVASSCAAPKACEIHSAGTYNYDAYTIPNDSGADACVTIILNVIDQLGCNLQPNAYVGSFDPNNICTNYEGHPGRSSGIPPSETTFSVVQPAGTDLVVEVHSVNAGALGCNYELTVVGNLCRPTPQAVEIPTVNYYGLGLLALLLLGGAIFLLRHKPITS